MVSLLGLGSRLRKTSSELLIEKCQTDEALLAATRAGCTEVINKAIKRFGIHIIWRVKNNLVDDCIEEAAKHGHLGHLQILQLFLEKSEGPGAWHASRQLKSSKHNALCAAMTKYLDCEKDGKDAEATNYFKILRFLLSSGIDPNRERPVSFVSLVHVHIFSYILGSPPSYNTSDEDELYLHDEDTFDSLIYQAAHHCSLPLVELLLEHGANPDGEGGEIGRPRSALQAAVERYCEPSSFDKDPPITKAVSYEIARMLLVKGAGVNFTTEYPGDTALILAVENEVDDPIPIMELRFEFGADPYHTNTSYEYPRDSLNVAMRVGSNKAVEFLEKKMSENTPSFWD